MPVCCNGKKKVGPYVGGYNLHCSSCNFTAYSLNWIIFIFLLLIYQIESYILQLYFELINDFLPKCMWKFWRGVPFDKILDLRAVKLRSAYRPPAWRRPQVHSFSCYRFLLFLSDLIVGLETYRFQGQSSRWAHCIVLISVLVQK